MCDVSIMVILLVKGAAAEAVMSPMMPPPLITRSCLSSLINLGSSFCAAGRDYAICPDKPSITSVTPCLYGHLERRLSLSGLEWSPGCHPERSEGSLSLASQTLRCAQG